MVNNSSMSEQLAAFEQAAAVVADKRDEVDTIRASLATAEAELSTLEAEASAKKRDLEGQIQEVFSTRVRVSP